MKKILLSCVAALGFLGSANAQLAEGSVFPYPGGATGRLTAVNAPYTGMGYNLDSLSDAGYTIYIDISATWCPPCWSYHNAKQLDSLWYFHGPTGMPGVSATTTNDVFVLFFQGEATSNLAELYDVEPPAIHYTTTELPYSQVTQGNWVTGTPFPMIDDTTSSDPTYGTAAIDAAWNITYFPTVYMICRDHLVHVLTQPSYTDAYAAAQAGCPSTPPATGSSVDAKTSTYLGTGYFVCNANPSVTFQNYSTTANITSATVTVKDGSGATVATQPWSGTLAPYQIANVTIPSFAGTSLGGYKYSVAVTGDINAANNTSVDSVFKVYSTSNVGTLPFSDDLMGAITYKYTFPSDFSVALPNPAWGGCPNPAGVTTNKYLLFDFYDFQAGTGSYDFVVGNFNTDGAASVTFEFDESYAMYSGNPSDEITVKVSHNCGSSWSTVWTGTGTTLTTHAAVSTDWVPTSSADWAHRTVTIPVSDTSNNMMIKFGGTSAYGNFAWVTNLKVTETPLAVKNVIANAGVTIAPNPAKDVTNIGLTLSQSANVQVQVIDALGRVVNDINQELNAGDQKIELSTANLTSGLYTVRISTGTEVTVKQLSVVK